MKRARGKFDLKAYWLHGEGAAKWATFTELYHHLRKHIDDDERVKRIAASWYHERYGRWPGEHHGIAAAAVNGQHVPGTPYNWRHGWIPLNTATALLHGKKKDAERLRAESGVKDLSLRRMSDDDLEQRMHDAIAREDFGEFDKLSAESDRREAAAPARDAARARREAQANERLDRMGQLIDDGYSEADAHVEVYGGTREDFHRKEAVSALRAQGYQGRSFDDLSRSSYRDHVDDLYARAEDDTRGVLLSREAEGYNARQAAKRGKLIDPRDLFTTNEATARKWSSKELRAWWDENGRPTLAEWRAELLDDPQQARQIRARRNALAAAAVEGGSVTRPPSAWFHDPQLDRPTALTIDDDGRVFGHVAAFGVPHLGLPGHTEAPRSRSGYRYFRTGVVRTEDGGDVPTGRITLGTGHASLEDGVTAAAEHYDHTGTAVADVAVGEDEHGIWCAGAVRPGTTPEQLHALRASPLSGDWRAIDGDLELVAALAVNVPGFPVPRAVAAAGQPVALVAAGALVAATAAKKKPAAPPKTSPTGAKQIGAFEDGSAKYDDGSVYDPDSKGFRQPAGAAKKAAPKTASNSDFESKHPRGAGGLWVPVGTARNAEAAKAQQDPKGKAAYQALLTAKPADQAALLAKMKDSDLEALSRIAYSFKSSDPKVVAARVGIANALAKRGKDVKNFGALGGGPAKKKAVAAAAATRRSTTTRRDTAMPVTLTEDEALAIRRALGVADDAPPAIIASALLEALNEQVDDATIEDLPTDDAKDDDAEPVARPGDYQLPEGLVVVDEALLAKLQADAARGAEARAKQEADARETLVASAVKDGRVAPARRQHWLEHLAADPGAETVLASLKPVVPVGEPVGHAGEHGTDPGADALYASVFGKDA